MFEKRYRWKNKHIYEQISVLDGKLSPTILLKKANYLNQVFRQWMKANIWIYKDRIIYVGERMPENITDCEIIDCEGLYLVPGYIEPHAHPFQLYNPLSLAKYASQFGTTALINDNIVLLLNLEREKAFSFIGEMSTIPSCMYWWCRFDGQTEIEGEEIIFSNADIKAWLDHDAVIQGGELTGWPKLIKGDDMMLHWLQEAKRLRKRIEGHFPGASEKTLAKMMLFGADCDHEAMTGKEVYDRLMQGYTVSLRHSSIRPDLPVLLDGLKELGITSYDKLMFNTDGSPPSFYENGMNDALIRMAIEKGIPVVDAYNMATINVARYYQIDHLLGNIGTGRIANINFLSDPKNPTPVSVLAKGKWVKIDDTIVDHYREIPLADFGLEPLHLDWDLTSDDFQFSMPFGIEMVNSVITKPYSISLDVQGESLSEEHDESFLILLDKNGKWKMNTLVKGYAKKLSGLASSFSYTGDIMLIGKNKADMLRAFNRLKELGGGIVISEQQTIVREIPLPLCGIMSERPVEELIKLEKSLSAYLREKGYRFADPIYSLLFFSSTHLPYIRVTQRGIYDVMNKTVLFPTIMR